MVIVASLLAITPISAGIGPFTFARTRDEEYQIIRREIDGKEIVLYREPYDSGETPGGEMVINDLWASPTGRYLIILRKVMDRWSAGPDFLRLVTYDTKSKYRRTLVGEKELIPSARAHLGFGGFRIMRFNG